MGKIYQILTSSLVLLFLATASKAATYYTRGAGGNWGTAATWSTVGCNGAASATVPGIGDDVVICASNGASAVSVTVNGVYSCNSLIIGTGDANATVTTSVSTYSLTVINGVTFNTGNYARVYTLSASVGTVVVGGFVNWITASGTNQFTVSTGNLSFASDLTITHSNQLITLTGAAKVNFNSNFTDSQNKLTTASACSVRFAGNYTTNSIAATWNSNSYAVFSGSAKSIIPNSNITFGFLTINTGGIVSCSDAAGAITVTKDLSLISGTNLTIDKAINVTLNVVLASLSTLTLNSNITIGRSWTNNGGTLIGGSNTVTFKGYNYAIGGTGPTTFPNLSIGIPNGAARVAYSLNANISCTSLTLQNNSVGSTSSFNHGISNPSLTVYGDATIKQLSGTSSNSWNINGGSGTVNGNLIFSGAENVSTKIAQVVVTTGSFTLDGTISWFSQTGTALVATEVITASTGTLTFNSSVSLPKGSGTIKATAAGKIYFNGLSAPSLELNAAGTGATLAVHTAAANSNVYFKAGLTNSNSAIFTYTAGSTQNFINSGTVTCTTAVIRFGHLLIETGVTLSAVGNIQLQNTWNDRGTFVPSTYSVTFNGTSSAIQSITRSSQETFFGLSVATASATLTLMNDVLVSGTLAMSGHNININGYTLTLGNGSGAILTRTAGTIYGGTFRRYLPSATAISSSAGNLYGLFPIGTSLSYRPVTINSTTNATTGGYVSALHNNSATTTNVSFNDGVNTIQRISDQNTTLSTSGLVGGTYTLNITYSGFNTLGTVNDLKLETYTGGTMGVVGTHSVTSGTSGNPTCKRSGLTAAQLSNVFVAGTINKTATPIIIYVYSRSASGNWNSTSAWSLSPGGAGATCTCVPATGNYAVVSADQTMTLNTDVTIEYVTVENGGILNGTNNLSITKELNLNGTGKLAPTTGAWSVANYFENGTGASTSGATISVSTQFSLSAGSSLTMSAALNISGNISLNGTLDIGSTTATFNGNSSATISGTGVINGSAGNLSITTANKSILAGTNLTIAPTVSLANGIVLTNNGTVTLNGNLTGGNSSSGWINASGSVLNAAAALLSTGNLTATASPNDVNYTSSSAQTIKPTTYDDLICSGSGTKTFAANFVVNSALQLKDAAILDEGIYVVSGAADLEMTGTSELKLQRSANGTYPELGGTYTLTAGTITINQTANTATLESANYYNLQLNGSRPYDMSNVGVIRNNLSIQNSASLTNIGELAIAGQLGFTSSGTLTLTGNIEVGNLVLSNGTLNDGGQIISITGNGWTNNGGTYTSTGEMRFTGTSAQAISGSSSTTFKHLTIQNTSSTGVTLNQSVNVTSELELIDGYFYTNASSLLSLSDNAISDAGTSASFVDGPMKKVGDDAFVFPVGDNGLLAKVAISDPASVATEFTAEYTRDYYNDGTQLTAPLMDVSKMEHWLLERTGSESPVAITLFWENAAANGINNCSDLTIAHWNGANWIEEPATAGGSCSGSGYITTNSEISSFSPFTFGSKSLSTSANPLPISLLDFDAKQAGNVINLSWKTASETSNDYFTIERSLDGIEFHELMQVEGAGNSSQNLNYKAIDSKPFEGVSYYRLKQTDYDGRSTVTNPVHVYFDSEPISGQPEIEIHPFPASGSSLELNVAGGSGTVVTVVILDLSGKEVFRKVMESDQVNVGGNYEINHQLITGTYVLLVDLESQVLKKKLIIIN